MNIDRSVSSDQPIVADLGDISPNWTTSWRSMVVRASPGILAGRLFILFALALTAAESQAQVPAPLPAPVQTLPTPADAATLAEVDAASISRDAPFQLYVWVPPWYRDIGYAAAATAANEVLSSSSVAFSPARIVRGDIELVRIELRQCATNAERLQRLFRNLNKLESIYFPFDDVFPQTFAKVPVVKSVASVLQRDERSLEAAFRAKDGSTVWKSVELVSEHDGYCLISYLGNTYRHPAKHLRYTQHYKPQRSVAEGVIEGREQTRALGDTAQLLPQFTQSNVPIIRLDEFIAQVYSSDAERRGLYYHFIGAINDAGERISFTELLRDLGAGKAEVKVPILQSKVTGKPRIVHLVYGNTVRPSVGTGLIAYTSDTLDNQRGVNWLVDVDAFEAVALAREVITEAANGTHKYYAFADELLLDTVPDNVACNHRLPEPYTTRLAAGAGCISCHSQDDNAEGYRTALSDFLELSVRSPRFRAFFQQDQILKQEAAKFKQIFANQGQGADVRVLNQDEFIVKQFNDFELFEQLSGEYFGSVERAVNRARQDRATTIQRIAGLHLPANVDASASTLVGQGIFQILLDYEYSAVTPAVALRDIGFDVKDERIASAVFARHTGTALGIDDPVIIALATGLSVDRGTYEDSYEVIIANRAANLRLLHRK